MRSEKRLPKSFKSVVPEGGIEPPRGQAPLDFESVPSVFYQHLSHQITRNQSGSLSRAARSRVLRVNSLGTKRAQFTGTYRAQPLKSRSVSRHCGTALDYESRARQPLRPFWRDTDMEKIPECPRESLRTNGTEEVSRRETKRVFRARAGRRSISSRGPEVERRDGRTKQNARTTAYHVRRESPLRETEGRVALRAG